MSDAQALPSLASPGANWQAEAGIDPGRTTLVGFP